MKRIAVAVLTGVGLLAPLVPAVADDAANYSLVVADPIPVPEGFVVTEVQDRNSDPTERIGLGEPFVGWVLDRGPQGELVVTGSQDRQAREFGSGENRVELAEGPPGKGSTTPEDIVLTRWHADGTLDWARRIAGPYMDRPRRVEIDARDGSIYLTGETAEAIDFGAGPVEGAPGCLRCHSAFVAKYSVDGELLWSTTFRPDEGIAYPQGLDIAPNGDLVMSFEWMDYITLNRMNPMAVEVRSASSSGSTHRVTLLPGETTPTPEGEKWYGSTRSTAVVRYAPDGELRWARVVSGAQNGGRGEVAVLEDDRIVVAASLWGPTRLLDGPTVLTTPRDDQQMFLALLNADATEVEWSSVILGDRAEPLALERAADGSLLLGVEHWGSRLYLGWPGSLVPTDPNGSRSWVLNVELDGTVRWAMPIRRTDNFWHYQWLFLDLDPQDDGGYLLTDHWGRITRLGLPLPEPDPQDPDPEDPTPEDPDPENPDPENPDPENPAPGEPEPEPDPGELIPSAEQVSSASISSPCASGTPRIMSDVPVGSYYDAAVRCLTRQGITRGVSDGAPRFDPSGRVTRAQMATFLWRLAGRPTPTRPNPFVDVPAGTWYSTAVTWLAERGITAGVGEGGSRFDPEGAVTRGQMAAFLWRFANRPAAPVASSADVPATAYYARGVNWLAHRGITVGYGGDPARFAPELTVTRAQMAAFLFRFGLAQGLWRT